MKVKSYFKKLFTVHCSLFTAKAGFTLIEIVMIIVIVSIAIPALLIVLGQETQQSVNAELQISAVNVGQAMMDEIRSKCWDETSASAANCGGAVTPSTIQAEAGEDRIACTGAFTLAPYNDVDDYNGYNETCTWGGPSFTTTVQVCYVPDTDLNSISPCVTAQASATDYKRIQVTVSNASMGSSTLVTVAGNY